MNTIKFFPGQFPQAVFNNGKTYKTVASAKRQVCRVLNSSYEGYEFTVYLVERANGRQTPVIRITREMHGFAFDLRNAGFAVLTVN